MKQMMAIHVTANRIQAAVIHEGKPVMVPNAVGGSSYHFDGVFPMTAWMGRQTYRCDELRLTLLFQRVLADVSRLLDVFDWEALVVVPTAFGGEAEEAIRRAGNQAGLPIVRVLPDVAVLSAYHAIKQGLQTAEQVIACVAEPDTIAVAAAECEAEMTEMISVVSGDTPMRAVKRLQKQLRVKAYPETAQGASIVICGEESQIKDCCSVLTDQWGETVVIYPQEAIVEGAALQTGSLVGCQETPRHLLLQTVTQSYFVQTSGGAITVIVPRDTSIPARKSLLFALERDNQTTAEIRLVRGDGLTGADCQWVCRQQIEHIGAGPIGGQLIRVTVDIRADHTVQLEAQLLDAQEQQQTDWESIAGVLPPKSDK